MAKPIVVVGVVGFNGLAPEATQAFLGAFYSLGKEHSGEFDFRLALICKKEQFRARNELVEMALAEGAEFLWQIDDDTVLRRDTFKVLMEGLQACPKAGVAGALYVQRAEPFSAVALQGVQAPNGTWTCEYIPPHRLKGTLEVDIVGGGCFLFRMEALKGLLRPYFWSDGEVGTDIQICLKLRESGWKVLCMADHEVGHVCGGKIIYPSTIPDDFKRFNERKAKVFEACLRYLGVSSEQFWAQVAWSWETHRALWESKPRDTKQEVEAFYKEPPLQDPLVVRGVWYNFFSDPGQTHMRIIQEWVHARQWHMRKVLDFGGGIGTIAEMFLEASAGYVELVELASGPSGFLAFRRKADKQAGVLVVRDRPSLLTFDVLVLMDVVEHLDDPRETLTRLLDHLSPKAWIITDAHCYEFFGPEKGVPQHLKRISPEDFAQLLREAGFVEGTCKYVWERRR